MEYLQSKAEGYVAQWIMHNPDAVQELSAYWFNSEAGKAIVWAVIAARKSGPFTLETIKHNCKWDRTRIKPEHFDLVFNQPEIDSQSLQYCINHFKHRGMLFDIYEAKLNDKVTISPAVDAAIVKCIERVKAGTETQAVWDAMHKIWCNLLNKKPLVSKAVRMQQIEAKRNELIKRFDS